MFWLAALSKRVPDATSFLQLGRNSEFPLETPTAFLAESMGGCARTPEWPPVGRIAGSSLGLYHWALWDIAIRYNSLAKCNHLAMLQG